MNRLQTRTLGPLALCALLAAVALPAQAELFNTGRTLKPSAFSISGEFQRSVDPSGIGAHLGVGIGLASQLDLGLQVRFPLEGSPSAMYYGGDLEFGLSQDGPSRPALSLSLGAHALGGKYAADATLMLSKVLVPHFEPYIAVDADIAISSDLGTHVRAVAGVCVPIADHFELLFEGGLGLTAITGDFLSAGFNVYF